MCASTLWPFSSSTRNMAFGSGSTTVPSTRMASSLGFARGIHLRFQRFRCRERPAGRSGQTAEYKPECEPMAKADCAVPAHAALCRGDTPHPPGAPSGKREHLGAVVGGGGRVLEGGGEGTGRG